MKDLVYPNELPLRTIALVVSVIAWIVLLIGSMGTLLFFMLTAWVLLLFSHSALIAYLRGNAIRISPKQMPDLCARVYRCARILGMQKVPDVYLVNGNGVLNAFATSFLGRDFVVLFSDVVDGLENRPGALDFYIGHELGHIRQKHLKWAKVLAPALFLPIIGPAYHRAREYTCDRHGLAVCEHAEDAQYGLAALAAGKRRWSQVDLAAYAHAAAQPPGFWMSLHELTGTYPWLHKRHAWVRALAEQRQPKLGGRHPLAYALSVICPGVPGLGFVGGIAIVSILAAVAIPAYQGYLARVETTVAYRETSSYREAISSYALQNRRWPDSLETAGLSPFTADKYISNVDLAARGTLLVTLAGPHLHDQVMTIKPVVVSNTIQWTCQGSMPKADLPAECAH